MTRRVTGRGDMGARPWRDPGYEARCRAETTAQGLDPLVRGLREAGVTAHVEQTGGFTMAVVVPIDLGTLVAGERTRNGYGVSFYPGDAWATGDADPVDKFTSRPLAQTVAYLKQAQLGQARRRPSRNRVTRRRLGPVVRL